MLLSLVFGFSLVQGAPPDVPKSHWAYRAVNELYRAGILQGYPEHRVETVPVDPKMRGWNRAALATAISHG